MIQEEIKNTKRLVSMVLEICYCIIANNFLLLLLFLLLLPGI